MSEIWKAIPDYEGCYEVSDRGHVRSLDRIVWCEGPVKGRYQSLKPGRVLRPGPMNAGHLTVMLGREGGSKCVHSLVLLAFVGPRPFGKECRHLDGNEKNNNLTNLEYNTRSQNSMDKKWHKGTRTAKLTIEQATYIKQHKQTPIKELTQKFNISRGTVDAIRAGRTHRDV